jgi:predicted enzyme related to lactoylglutathione lyase
MLLIYLDEQALGEAERQACYRESTELAHRLNAAGQFLAADPLQPTPTATSVRVRNGKRVVTDGPFAETREQLGGYFMVNTRSLDEAIAIAERIPMAQKGTVEIRPVVEIADLPGRAGAPSTHPASSASARPKAGSNAKGVDRTLARPGGLSYLEIPAIDPGRSAAFYRGVLGWKVEQRATNDFRFEDPACHLIGRWVTGRAVAREPSLLPYVYVDRIDEAVEQVGALGGEVVRAPYPEGDLLVATVRDPAGNLLGLWQATEA